MHPEIRLHRLFLDGLGVSLGPLDVHLNALVAGGRGGREADEFNPVGSRGLSLIVSVGARQISVTEADGPLVQRAIRGCGTQVDQVLCGFNRKILFRHRTSQGQTGQRQQNHINKTITLVFTMKPPLLEFCVRPCQSPNGFERIVEGNYILLREIQSSRLYCPIARRSPGTKSIERLLRYSSRGIEFTGSVVQSDDSTIMAVRLDAPNSLPAEE